VSPIPASQAATAHSKIQLLDGKLHVFRRPATKFWWCGFHRNGVYIRTSTKCSELDAAVEAAKAWYFRKQGELEAGAPIAPRHTTLAHYAKLALLDYERLAEMGQRSPHYVQGLKEILNNQLLEFFGPYPITSVNQSLWHRYLQQHLLPRKVSAATIHAYLNGVRIVFRRAKLRGELENTPIFLSEHKPSAKATPRTWFQPEQYVQLYRATRKNISLLKDTRWHTAAMELHDYVLFVANSGLRVGEARNVRFCDVKFDKERTQTGKTLPILIIQNIKGKRGTGACKTFYGAARPFQRIIERRGLKDKWQSSEEKIFEHYHRDMFNTVLNRCGLKQTTDRPPLRRDLMSLRHTYICFRLMAGAGIWDIAANCRTSVAMIENHYARWLNPLLANINTASLKRFGTEEA